MPEQLPITVSYIIQDGKLVPFAEVDITRRNIFIKSLTEGQKIEVTFQTQESDHSYGQLSRLHVSIRQLSMDTGTSFEDMKKEIKIRMNYKDAAGELKSFSDASKDDLSLAIQTCMAIGDIVGSNLNSY